MKQRLLFICPSFNNYENKILAALDKKFLVDTIFYEETEIFNIYGIKKILVVLFRLLFQLTSLNLFESIKISIYRLGAKGSVKN
ncbi:hypothetical protein CS022_00085 [Veronia nyctiphanis]|uniref:Uncharacterized protein n=1 Tax=Veronia nyctiphanis TaxID=1278244 RepID=A0A4Q0YTW7_9GAMM|nr:hypothetical protein CS022_00085 [Veronia nyctiphanis]